MPKRSATEVLTSTTQQVQKAAKTSQNASRRENIVPDEAGEFEDEWEDEFSEEEVAEEADDNEDGMDVDQVMPAIEEEDAPPAASDVFIPGKHKLEPGEEMEPDDSVYLMRHTLLVDWSCLSFDILRDNLGDERQRYPATAYLVTGTQAASGKNNEVLVMKTSSLHRTQKDGDDSDSESDDGEEDLDEDPVVESRSIPHTGGVNRIRAQPLPNSQLPPVSQPYHVASWSETGKVHIWDVRPLIESLDVSGYTIDKRRTQTPVYTVNNHGRTEGFAMDWAIANSSLRLVTGDNDSKIFLTTSSPSGFNTAAQPFTSHTSSVEDLQWSPSELTIFASCSADSTAAASIDSAHESDVNVISWNKSQEYLLLSGGDEGGLKIWDLRNIKNRGAAPVSFDWHKAPITSVEWHPTDNTAFAASGADNQVSLWDISVEPDDDEMGGTGPTPEQEVPAQLLFSHYQRDTKEVHWHPQIPGTIIATAYDGFDIFKTISL
ncbi:Ribosome assembly protein rrb1 [Mycena chlorophos]|uniref:Ribosome assembly protein rrb1 n=1 Tax=Mycena chlorophos TaxID=658473 RepID=A0A8H6T4Z1_MYCCL|nr:Ribosome assembly protein rrb1 [Mycena chlorophos]